MRQKYFKEFSNNYKPDLNLISLQYVSQTDKLTHYVEVNLNGEVVTNKLILMDDNVLGIKLASDNQYAERIS